MNFFFRGERRESSCNRAEWRWEDHAISRDFRSAEIQGRNNQGRRRQDRICSAKIGSGKRFAYNRERIFNIDASRRHRKNHSPESVLSMVGLATEFLKRKIGELSSGELQRIMVAWSVIGHPDLLLFDEPTAS